MSTYLGETALIKQKRKEEIEKLLFLPPLFYIPSIKKCKRCGEEFFVIDNFPALFCEECEEEKNE